MTVVGVVLAFAFGVMVGIVIERDRQPPEPPSTP